MQPTLSTNSIRGKRDAVGLCIIVQLLYFGSVHEPLLRRNLELAVVVGAESCEYDEICITSPAPHSNAGFTQLVAEISERKGGCSRDTGRITKTHESHDASRLLDVLVQHILCRMSTAVLLISHGADLVFFVDVANLRPSSEKSGLRVVFDCHGAAGKDLLLEVLQQRRKFSRRATSECNLLWKKRTSV